MYIALTVVSTVLADEFAHNCPLRCDVNLLSSFFIHVTYIWIYIISRV